MCYNIVFRNNKSLLFTFILTLLLNVKSYATVGLNGASFCYISDFAPVKKSTLHGLISKLSEPEILNIKTLHIKIYSLLGRFYSMSIHT